MVQIARRFVEFENEIYCQIGGITNPYFSVFSGLKMASVQNYIPANSMLPARNRKNLKN
jgi:hypothetical protein